MIFTQEAAILSRNVSWKLVCTTMFCSILNGTSRDLLDPTVHTEHKRKQVMTTVRVVLFQITLQNAQGSGGLKF